MRRDLERRGFDSGAARRALDRLEGEGWLQDLAAARALVRTKGIRYGRRRIARELSARGFAEETAGLALEELEGGIEEKTLQRAFRRVWKASAGLPLRQRRLRARRSLLLRGFAPDAISAMIRSSHDVDGSSGEIP